MPIFIAMTKLSVFSDRGWEQGKISSETDRTDHHTSDPSEHSRERGLFVGAILLPVILIAYISP